MFNLEKSILNFKQKLNERNILTEDDLAEIETHIIDKVDDLKQQGLNDNDAFNKAVSDLGSINEIAAEYSKVNLSTKSKFMLFCIGYVSINLMLSIISLVNLFISYVLRNPESSTNYKYIDICTPLMELKKYEQSASTKTIIFLINTTLVILMLYLIFKKNNNLLSVIADKILLISNGNYIVKVLVALFIVIIPILSNIFSYITWESFLHDLTYNISIYNYNISFLCLILLIALIVNYMKSKTSENKSSYMIFGYLMFTIASRCIPNLSINMSVLINQFNLLFIVISFIILFVITCCFIMLTIQKKFLEKKPNIIVAILFFITFIVSYLYLPHYPSLDSALINEYLDKFSNLSFIIQLCTNLLAAASIFANNKISFRRKSSIV